MALTLPYSAWPDADRVMWERLFAQGSPLDDRGPLADVRMTTRHSLAMRYGRWLKWLQDSAPEALSLAPVDRIHIRSLRAWLEDLSHTQPMTQRAFVDGVLRIGRALAPERDWTLELRLQRALRAAANRDHGSRKRGRILSSDVLFDAGRRIVIEEAPKVSSPLYRATTIRDGAMIALLALMPMRRRAFAGLRLGVSILERPEGFTIALPRDLTKSGLPWEADIPAPAADLLRVYLQKARPLLAARGGNAEDHLWLGRTGRMFGENYLRTIVSKGVERITGIPVSPHLFRDAAATTLRATAPPPQTSSAPSSPTQPLASRNGTTSTPRVSTRAGAMRRW